MADTPNPCVSEHVFALPLASLGIPSRPVLCIVYGFFFNYTCRKAVPSILVVILCQQTYSFQVPLLVSIRYYYCTPAHIITSLLHGWRRKRTCPSHQTI